MAQTFITFVVDDTSPTITYSPFPDTFGTPDLSAGWNPYFTLSGFATSQGVVGQGTSQHITSLDGASLGFQWRGSGIKLLGNVTQASYNISIDGKAVPLSSASSTDNVLLDLNGLSETLHNITLTAVITPEQALAPNTSSMVVFDQAVVVSSPIMPNSNNGFNDSTLSDADVKFSGLWSIEPTSAQGARPQFHTSNNPGDAAFTMFNGSTLLVLGKTSPGAGNYTVVLDGGNSTVAFNQTFSAKSSFTQDDSLLFFASDLDPTVLHTVQVINENTTELALAVGGFRAFIPYIIPPATNTTIPSAAPISDLGSKPAFEKGTIAAFALAGILAFLLISGVLFFFFVYRPRRRRRRQEKYARSGRRASGRPAAGDNEREYNEKGYHTGNSPVLNIAPMYDVKEEPDLEADSTNKDPPVQEGPSKRFSAISEGLQRWTRAAVRGSLGGATLGGLRFRHSESPPGHVSQDTTPGTDDGSPAGSGRARPMSEISSWTETSSAARRRQEKRLGKMRAVVSRSWLPSPSYSAGAGSSEGHAYRNSRRESRRQSRRASQIPSSPPIAEFVGAAVAGAAAESAFQGSGTVSGRRRTLPVPNLNMPTRRASDGDTHEPPSYAASVANSQSTPSTRTTNPRSANASLIIPQSMSARSADAANEHDGVAESATVSDVANTGHSPRASVVRPRDNLAAVLAGPRSSAAARISSAVDRKDMRDVLRSLSPRTSSTPTRQLPAPPSKSDPELSSRWMPSFIQPLAMGTLPEEQSPDSATSPTRQPLLAALASEPENNSTRSEPVRPVKRLPQTPSSPISSSSSLMPSSIGGGDDPAATSFLSLPQTSPFRVDFPASRNPSLRPLPSPHGTPERVRAALSAGDSSNPDIYFTPSVASSSVAQSSSAQAVEDVQEGSSKRPFRFTALTLPTSSAVPTISSPQAPPGGDDSPHSNSIDSFLDFSNSREGSVNQRPQSSKHASRSLPLPPVIVEPQSRWSNTTVPTMTTSYGGGPSSYQGNVSSGESQYLGIPTGDDEFRHFSTSSTFPIPVQISIPPSPHHIMEHTPSPSGDSSQSSERLRVQSFRASGVSEGSGSGSGERHVHPAMPIDIIDSPTEAAVSDSDIQFRHSFATDSDPHTVSAAPPETSSADEIRPRPYDPSILVSRVLGLPSPTSSTTVRPPASHGRTLSTPSLSIGRSMLTSKSDVNSSDDRLNPGPSS